MFLSATSKLALGPTQTSVQWVPRASSLEIKQLGHEADSSCPSSSKIKNGGTIPQFLYTYVWLRTYLTRQKDNFTFTLC
jgi:hypothetical protein